MWKQKSIACNEIVNIDYGDWNETINLIISEYSKLGKNQYKTIHDWLEKMIHRELRKKLEFNHTVKWYINKPESILENETHKTDHLIAPRRPLID